LAQPEADNQSMSTRAVQEPFAGDPSFWMSVRACGYALVTLLIAVALTAFFGLMWVATFGLPIGLLVCAALTARASTKRSRAHFADRRVWREAERTAVATAFVPALLWRR
jgi:hypothetical protein